MSPEETIRPHLILQSGPYGFRSTLTFLFVGVVLFTGAAIRAMSSTSRQKQTTLTYLVFPRREMLTSCAPIKYT